MESEERRGEERKHHKKEGILVIQKQPQARFFFPKFVVFLIMTDYDIFLMSEVGANLLSLIVKTDGR